MNKNRNREIQKQKGAQMQPVEKRARVGPFTADEVCRPSGMVVMNIQTEA